MFVHTEWSLYNQAVYLLQNTTWSILPLQGGDGKSSKQPPERFTWHRYTQQRATLQNLNGWFEKHTVRALGIICGSVSQLTVIEFDDAEHYQRFEQQFPHLLNTYTVLSATRQLPHLYYQTAFNTQNTEAAFGSIRSQGRYVVAGGSQIGTKTYEIVNADPLQSISPQDLMQVRDFLVGERADTSSTHKPISINTLVSDYKANAPIRGRNNSLFQTALKASRAGLDSDTLRHKLTPVHVQTASPHPHIPESWQQRAREAHMTIASAYRYSPTTPSIKKSEGQLALPNRIREIVLQKQKSAVALRLIEALMNDADSEHFLTAAQIKAIGHRCRLSSRSVQRVLRGDLSKYKGKRLIPIYHPVGYGDKREQKPGRPAARYRLPTLERLCKVFSVGDLRSDPLPKQALQGEKAYRMALQRALIASRPGQYGLKWMASRLNVSRRTIQRYHKALKVVRQPVIAYRELDHRLNVGPVGRRRGGVTPGVWLQSADGQQKWPCVPGLACKLLARGLQLTLCRRLPNHYQLSETGSAGNDDVIWRHQDVPEALTSHVKAVAGTDSRHVLPLPGTDRRVDLPVCDARGRSLRWHLPKLDDAGYPRDLRRRYTTRLSWDSVDEALPPPDIASEMAKQPQWWQHHYLMVPDYYGSGRAKRFPVMRGLALRLMKEHGSGYVYFVTHLEPDAYRALYAEGLRALVAGDLETGLRYLRELQIVS